MVPLQIELPENFLDEEVRCGHTVTKKMKEVWAVELDLLNKFTEVCNKYDIKWFADAGTMLGAIRHKGFIPWDDDIDVFMFRDDYEKFLKVENEFKDQYFLQTESNDFGSIKGHAKLQNINTTMITYGEDCRNFSFSQGIWLDIFPYDNIPDNEDELLLLSNELEEIRHKMFLFRDRLHNDLNETRIFRMIIKNILTLFVKILHIKNPYSKSLDKRAQKYNNKVTDKVGALTFRPLIRYLDKTKSLYNDIMLVPFEFLKVPVPVNYEKALTEMYGDWKVLKKNQSIHGGDIIINTEKNYKVVLKELKDNYKKEKGGK